MMKNPLENQNPLQKLILAYAKRQDRARYALLFAIDTKFGNIIRTTSETLIGQMKLTWWRDILTTPAADRPTGEPLVQAINEIEGGRDDISGLLRLLDGWELLLEDFPWDDRQFDNYAQNRGQGFFSFGLGPNSRLSESQGKLAQSWALWDFARHCSDEDMRKRAFEKCTEANQSAGSVHFDRNGRPCSILCKLLASDVKKARLSDDLYTPSHARRIIWHGVTGR